MKTLRCTMVLLTAGVGTLTAQSSADSIAACAAIESDVARLECFDELAEGEKQETAGEETGDASDDEGTSEFEAMADAPDTELILGWIVKETEDPMDGSR